MTLLYLLTIVVANIITAMFPPIHVYNLIIPCGSFLVGITFFLRDFLQLQLGKTKIYKLIVIATCVSCVMSTLLDDSISVAIASVVSFFVSESLDTEVFTRLKVSIEKRIVISGLVGGVLDSSIFIILALSPIGSNVLSWESVPYAILGQMIVKFCMQFLAIPLLRKLS